MTTAVTNSNIQVQINYIGDYSLDNAPSQPVNPLQQIDFVKEITDNNEVIGAVENALWPTINQQINVNSVSDEFIKKLVADFIESLHEAIKKREYSPRLRPWIQIEAGDLDDPTTARQIL
jgi:hypothetical protein